MGRRSRSAPSTALRARPRTASATRPPPRVLSWAMTLCLAPRRSLLRRRMQVSDGLALSHPSLPSRAPSPMLLARPLPRPVTPTVPVRRPRLRVVPRVSSMLVATVARRASTRSSPGAPHAATLRTLASLTTSPCSRCKSDLHLEHGDVVREANVLRVAACGAPGEERVEALLATVATNIDDTLGTTLSLGLLTGTVGVTGLGSGLASSIGLGARLGREGWPH